MKIQIEVESELFSFISQQDWVNKAQSRFRECGASSDNYICIDSVGRVCKKGKEFMRATAENTYPITVYKLAGL